MGARDRSASQMGSRKRCGTRAPADSFAESVGTEQDKVAVMLWLTQLATDWGADWNRLDNGDIQLRFNTGERFLLGKTHITRLE